MRTVCRCTKGGGAGSMPQEPSSKVRTVDNKCEKPYRAILIMALARIDWRSNEGIMRPGSWEGRSCHEVAINYDKLRELCLKNAPATATARNERDGHQQFMKEYRSIINTRRRPQLSQNSTRKPHYCDDIGPQGSFDITTALVNIHGRDKRQQESVDLNSRLRAMLSIVKKQSVQRSSAEVKELAHHFHHFPGLLPRMEMEVLVGMASRAKMEQIPKHATGYSLPERGGVYIILQGCVEKLTVDPTTKEISSEMLEAGQFFGELTPTKQPSTVKLSCPSYSVKGLCTLVRLMSFNYERVIETWKSTSFHEKSQLIKSCPLLQSVSPSVVTKLAEAVTWETIEPNHTILSEGEEISRVAFIQSGSCTALVRVPRAPRFTQVTVGHLTAGDCIGEGMLRGYDRQPYTVVSTSRLRVGWVTSTTLRVNEVDKHILSDKKFTLKPLTSEDIVQGIVTERGIRRGHSKWCHSRSHSAGGIIL